MSTTGEARSPPPPPLCMLIVGVRAVCLIGLFLTPSPFATFDQGWSLLDSYLLFLMCTELRIMHSPPVNTHRYHALKFLL